MHLTAPATLNPDAARYASSEIEGAGSPPAGSQGPESSRRSSKVADFYAKINAGKSGRSSVVVDSNTNPTAVYTKIEEKILAKSNSRLVEN